jgi:hypothetical protein
VLGSILIAIPVVALCHQAERARLRGLKNELLTPSEQHVRRRFSAPGVETPVTLPARVAALNDDEQVIGIEVGGKARAYRLRAMRGLREHIINDVVGGSAVSVTFCDMSGCAKAFSGGDCRAPLKISQAGLLDNRMLLSVADVCYDQETGAVVESPKGKAPPPFPFETMPFAITTWREWKARHSETDVSMGLGPAMVRREQDSGR